MESGSRRVNTSLAILISNIESLKNTQVSIFRYFKKSLIVSYFVPKSVTQLECCYSLLLCSTNTEKCKQNNTLPWISKSVTDWRFLSIQFWLMFKKFDYYVLFSHGNYIRFEGFLIGNGNCLSHKWRLKVSSIDEHQNSKNKLYHSIEICNQKCIASDITGIKLDLIKLISFRPKDL